jgi:soluble lytic murein transglycosylase-like protein
MVKLDKFIFIVMCIVASWAVATAIYTWGDPADPYVPSVEIPAGNRTLLDDYPDRRCRELVDEIIRYNPRLDQQTVEDIADAIITTSDALSLDWRDLTALIAIESRFVIDPVNRLCPDATGLGQVRTKIWAKHLIDKGIIDHADDLKLILYNVRASAYILDHYRRTLEIDPQALRRYNGAPAGSMRYVNKFNRARGVL